MHMHIYMYYLIVQKSLQECRFCSSSRPKKTCQTLYIHPRSIRWEEEKEENSSRRSDGSRKKLHV